MSIYRYQLTSTGHSSSRYGNCEVCGEHASEVFIQSEHRRYVVSDIEDLLEDPALYVGGELGWTANGCHYLFGHRGCLIDRRKE